MVNITDRTYTNSNIPHGHSEIFTLSICIVEFTPPLQRLHNVPTGWCPNKLIFHHGYYYVRWTRQDLRDPCTNKAAYIRKWSADLLEDRLIYWWVHTACHITKKPLPLKCCSMDTDAEIWRLQLPYTHCNKYHSMILNWYLYSFIEKHLLRSRRWSLQTKSV